jgi:hypothetical protein
MDAPAYEITSPALSSKDAGVFGIDDAMFQGRVHGDPRVLTTVLVASQS